MSLPCRFDAILFDFDGVLIESEAAGNRRLADWLTARGHPTSPADAAAAFMGLAGTDFLAALAARIGGPVPDDFHADYQAAGEAAIADGLPEVAGAVAFVRALPAALPIAVASSSTTRWIAAHLAHLGLAERFGGRISSGAEHVARGKPAPDIYLHAADGLGVDIARCAIIEDSVVGVTGAVASGAFVIGLCAGTHCGHGHRDLLLARGAQVVASDFGEVAAALA